MIEGFAAALRERAVRPRAIRAIGAMADLVPRHQLAEITTLLNAPYVNTFGATETGLPPATASFIPIGEAPTDLAKRQSAFCEVRLFDPDDHEVPDGEPASARSAARPCSAATGGRLRSTPRISAAGSTWATCSSDARTAASISSTAPST